MLRQSHRRLLLSKSPSYWLSLVLGCASLGLPLALAQTAPSTAAPATIAATPGPGATTPAPVTAPVASGGAADDRFPGARAQADQLSASYEAAHAKNIAEIEQLMRTKRCQISKIGGDLDRTLDAMHQWLDAETGYWRMWAEQEQKRVDGQQKTLISLEADQKRVSDLIDNEKEDRDELLRKRADLERYGKRTQEIISQMDSLVKDIQDSEARLANAQKDYDDLTVSISNMKGSLTARLVDMRQNVNRLEAYGQQMTAYYEEVRKGAQEVCNTKQPETRRVPLSKSDQ